MDLVGKVVAQHRILANLGDGGMGNVYLAEHETIKRRAAIKVLHRRFLDEPETVERFLNEARAANRIQHSGIVDIYDGGRDAQIGAYLVMEYLEGETLAARIAKGLLPTTEACRIIGAVATVLEAAHDAGIVHRDLKPANIFVTTDGERIKIVDFGIAKLFGDTSMVRTRTGELLGTPIYMSPEQCHGAKSVDHRTDIYSLGVIAYQLLCGRVPFKAEGFGELIAMHMAQAPAQLRPQRPEISPALESVVLKALSKDPMARQQSMTELQHELDAAQDAASINQSLPPTVRATPSSKKIEQPNAGQQPTETRDHLPTSWGRRLLLSLLVIGLLGSVAGAYVYYLREDSDRRCTAGDFADCRGQCDLGNHDSCLELARMYRSGDGVAVSAGRAVALLRPLCDKKLPEGCRLLGQLYARGEGVRQDEAQAAILLRQACEAGSLKACGEAGLMYRDGKGVAPNVKEAAPLLRRGCDGGDDRSCLLLGELYTDKRMKDLGRARALLQRACDRRRARACIVLGELAEGKRGGEADLDKAGRFYKRGCSLGDADACVAEKRVSAQVTESRHHRRTGWVYLGAHENGRWRSRYFEIVAGTRPEKLVGKVLRALRRSNIRFGPPDKSGLLGRVIGGILPDTNVRVLAVQRWKRTGYVWARMQTVAGR